jgi:hypothetical protein
MFKTLFNLFKTTNYAFLTLKKMLFIDTIMNDITRDLALIASTTKSLRQNLNHDLVNTLIDFPIFSVL